MIRTKSLLTLAIIAVSGVGSPVHAQDLDPRLVQADSLYEARSTAEALTLLEVVEAERPGDYEVLWRAARSAFGLGVLEEIEPVRDRFYERAVEYSRRASEAAPQEPLGFYWLSAARGRQALHASTGDKPELAGEILDAAERVLEIDPEHAGAHHVLGKLHMEIMSLAGFKRWFGSMFMKGGGALDRASWEQARYHLEKAVENDGTVIVYRLDLAVMYEKTDEDELAVEQIRELLAMEVRDPFDAQLKADAEELLDDLTG